MSWCAFIDESESNRKLDPDAYILAASIMPTDSCDAVRQAMVRLRLAGQRKVHWVHESDKRRFMLVETIARLEVLHLVIVRSCHPTEPSERRRRKCMERLVLELAGMGVGQVTMEARAPKQNRSDMHLVDVLRARDGLVCDMWVDHIPGPEEPLLWIPDVIAGSVVAARCGNRSYAEQIAPVTTILSIAA